MLLSLVRLAIGFGCGLATLAVPLHLASLSTTPAQRDQFGLAHQLAVVIGVVVAQGAGFVVGSRWRLVPGGCAVVAAILCASNTSRKRSGSEEVEPLLWKSEEEASNRLLRDILVDRQLRAGRECPRPPLVSAIPG